MKANMDIYKTLVKIHKKYSTETNSNKNSQMCVMWSTDDPPDILECTEPLEEINDQLNLEIDEDDAIEIYDMTIKEASEYISNLMSKDSKYFSE